MNTIVDLVVRDLLKEVEQEYKATRNINSRLLSALNCVFGKPLLAALDLVDKEAVVKYTSPSGKVVYQVKNSAGKTYTCPVSLQFCPCLSFAYGVLKRSELITCKHILAIHLCKAMNKCQNEEMTEEQLSTVLYEQEY